MHYAGGVSGVTQVRFVEVLEGGGSNSFYIKHFNKDLKLIIISNDKRWVKMLWGRSGDGW
jgi:hypothetical protein